MLMLVGYGNNEEVIKITSSGIEVKEDETFISAPQGNTWEQILREMQELATQASASQTAAAASATSAAESEQVAVSKAAETENAAEQTVVNAKAADTSATLSESWAVGGTGTREGEDTNNAQYWAQQAQSIAGGQLGWYETEQALQTAHPTGENGQWAIIGSTDTIWTWDSDTSAWVNSGAQVDLSNYYTKAQADAAFATAAQGTKADSAVQSVNGKTGSDVKLVAADVGAPEAAWSNIKTYTDMTQLGLASGGVTTAEVFNAMPLRSQAMIVGSDVSDAPAGDAIILIYKWSGPRGRAFAFSSRGTGQYTMLILTGGAGTGLTGEWVAM